MSGVGGFYGLHGAALWAGGAVGVMVLMQVAFLLWTSWRLQELAHLRERLSRLADGLALLTDTTEAGLATIARELQQPGRPARAASRASVNKRVVAAARKGTDLGHIAEHESLSESEVRLHLKLAEARSQA
jgi:hypothetical protein